jgi:hypothetical protein
MEELFGLGLHSGIVVSISFGGLSLDTLDKLQAARCDGFVEFLRKFLCFCRSIVVHICHPGRQSETVYMKINFQ